MLQKLFSYRVVPLLRHGLLFWLESVASEWKLLSHSYNMALLEATTFSNMLFMMHFKVWKQITFSMKCKTHRKHITITAFFSAAQVSAGWISAIDLLRQLCLRVFTCIYVMRWHLDSIVYRTLPSDARLSERKGPWKRYHWSPMACNVPSTSSSTSHSWISNAVKLCILIPFCRTSTLQNFSLIA